MRINYNSDFMPPDTGALEVVERKGLGHPDTLTDGIAESSAVAYAEYCLERFGVIPHHNLDKAMLLGGMCVQEFGGGSFQAPVSMLFMGRASKSFGGEEIPLEDIQDASAKEYLTRIMPHFDVNDPNSYGSQSLTTSRSTRPYWFSPRTVEDLPEYSEGGPYANDTATMISYWPLTDTERLALDLEGYFYQDDDNGMPEPRFSFIGQDIKVMSVRNNDSIDVTVALPQITYETPDMDTYLERRQAIEEELQEYANEIVGDRATVSVKASRNGKTGEPRLYLVTGGSCTDFGEEGAVGRGNKTHGIISSFRPNTMEAPHGKNPTYFVGKVLGFNADFIARTIHERTGARSQVALQADMGDYLYEPANISVSTDVKVPDADIESIVDECFSIGRETTERIVRDKYFVPRTNTYKTTS